MPVTSNMVNCCINRTMVKMLSVKLFVIIDTLFSEDNTISPVPLLKLTDWVQHWPSCSSDIRSSFSYSPPVLSL